MKKSIEELKQEFLKAEEEYQFAVAAGDPARLTAALKAHRATFDAFNTAKKADFKRREKAGKNAV